MKARMLYLLLLLACTACTDSEYDYALTWTCQSPGGCERAKEVMLIDRLVVYSDAFFFESTWTASFSELAQRVASSSLPPGCYWLYGLSLFGQELEPSMLCSASHGYDLELSIPNPDPATRSEWLVKAREL